MKLFDSTISKVSFTIDNFYPTKPNQLKDAFVSEQAHTCDVATTDQKIR